MLRAMKAPLRLKAYRERHSLSQRQLADELRTVQPHLSRIEAGTRTPALALAARIERLTGIPASEWLDENEHDGPLMTASNGSIVGADCAPVNVNKRGRTEKNVRRTTDAIVSGE